MEPWQEVLFHAFLGSIVGAILYHLLLRPEPEVITKIVYKKAEEEIRKRPKRPAPPRRKEDRVITPEIWERFRKDREKHRYEKAIIPGSSEDLFFEDWAKRKL